MRQTASHLLDLSRARKRIFQIVADMALLVLCFSAAMFLRLESFYFVDDLRVWQAFLPILPITIGIFYRLGLYNSVMRFVSGHVLSTIGTGVAVSAVILFSLDHLLTAPIPRSVPAIYAVLMIGAAAGMRFAVRWFFRSMTRDLRQPIVIYGAGEAGRQLKNALANGREYEAIAFVDDSPLLHNTLIGDTYVYPPSAMLRLINEFQIRSILLALPSVSKARRREIVSQLEPLGVDVKTLPGIADIVSGKASFSELRLVTPEDLLGRDPVPAQPALMGLNIKGKVVLVSGAGGSIGSELCRQIIAHHPARLILLEMSEYALYAISTELRETLAQRNITLSIEPILGSVQNQGKVRSILRGYGVQTIYHAAAYKHVVLVEENVVEGIRNNVFGTKVIAQAAAECGVESFILISTDKAVRPTNFMGASKRMAELICQSLAEDHAQPKYSMVRFGNVLGSSGSVIPRFKAQIEQGGPVTVTHRDITRFFMTIPEASQLVIQAGAMGKGGDVFVLDMGEPVKILDLAISMISLSGLKPYIMEQTEEQDSARGDIGIKIVGLNKGEKLYEELLIGNNPSGTDHPRIMTATEVSLPQRDLEPLLTRLEAACAAQDLDTIRAIFLEAPLGFQPTSPEIHDLMWRAQNAARLA